MALNVPSASSQDVCLASYQKLHDQYQQSLAQNLGLHRQKSEGKPSCDDEMDLSYDTYKPYEYH